MPKSSFLGAWPRAVALAAPLAISLLYFQPAAAADVAELVPADVELAVMTDDLAAASAAWQRTRWGALLSGDRFAPLRKQLQEANIPAPLHLRPWFGIDWQELSARPGPAALVLFADGTGQPQAALLFPTAEGHDEWLGRAERYFAQRQFVRREDNVSRATIVSFAPPPNRPRATAPAWFSGERCSGVATSRAGAAALAQRLAASDFPSLARVPEYGAAMRPAAGGSSVRFFVRPIELWKRLQARDARPNPDWLAIQARQGGESLRGILGTVTFPDSGQCDLELAGEILLSRPLKKGSRILDLKPGDSLPLPGWLAEDFAALSLWQCDVPQFVSAFGQLFDEVSEPGPDGQGLFEDILDGLRDDPEGPRIDLRREVFPQLGPQMLSLADRAPAAKGAETRGLLVVQCRNPAAVTRALERYFATDEEIQRGKIGSRPFWTIGPGRSLFVEGEGKTLAPIRAVLVDDKQLLLASHPEMIASRLAKEAIGPAAGGPLRSWLDWQKAASGAQACARVLALEKQWLDGAYQAASQPPATKEEEQNLPERTLRFLLLGDLPSDDARGSLPAWPSLESQLYATGLTLDLSPSGFRFRGGVLRQPRPAP